MAPNESCREPDTDDPNDVCEEWVKVAKDEVVQNVRACRHKDDEGRGGTRGLRTHPHFEKHG
eukprot:CAMPEP_0175995728 /NCGR_PEP_ID=MMETSP0108-20121206/55287_1 /TAXON_ID=195067 ORGANISM="Goniomonas pacifica, Strain CCMP1869" /NCGR_SAMPLE_ID=MMETSP0108 /ASSEMBLY_ACC=CAM_ASM_000204 /LENGTH=61 /DNA_ID=CAMNT_0017327871 /DNA_START=174 /DNA_END=359 /DNA_ORIENTATION=+